MKLTLSIGTSLDDIKLQDLGRLFSNLEELTGIEKIEYEPNLVTFTFINPNYRTDIDVGFLEIKYEGEKMFHNEESFFKKNYIPRYPEVQNKENDEDEDDYDSSY